MDILGIGPLELLFIVLIALIVLGPKDMVKAGRSLGRALKTIVSSDTWRVVTQASREMRNLPNRLMREANLEDIDKQLPKISELNVQPKIDEINRSLKQSVNEDLSPWTTPPEDKPAPAESGAPAGKDSGPGANPPDGAAGSMSPTNTAEPAPVDTTHAAAQLPEEAPPGAGTAVEHEEPAPNGEQKGDHQA